MRHKLMIAALVAAFGASAQHHATLDLTKSAGRVNPDMYGVFFEDINFAADGGLYAELVKNRSFDFPQPFTGWTPFGAVEVRSDSPAFPNNPNYVRVTADGRRTRSGLDNEGFRGIGIQNGEDYDFSMYARSVDGRPVKFSIELVDTDSKNPVRQEITVEGKEWKKYESQLKANFTEPKAKLRVVALGRDGEQADLDHISLFPHDTWKGRPGGLRKDLVQALADLNPGVFRFPGGCIIEGNTLDTRYQWKNSIGPVENRPLNENRWNYTFTYRAAPDYFQTYGLGFYEYFQLCEDLGAAPLPVISCGLACQYESNEKVPVEELQPFVDDALDLIEFANGPADSKWGKVRAEMGHPEPFGLKYLAVGNEQWGEVYPERLEVFSKAIRAKYPDIQLVGSSGPSADGKDFDYLWSEMTRLKADLVDEHYYKSPDWFLANARRYDNYSRKGPKVFAGEYASHDHSAGKANNWLAALSEAAFMTGLERNADVVRLATYAPLFAHVDAWQWNPDMIWFDNLRSMKTPNYYVQQLYAQNPGTKMVTLTTDGEPLAGQDQLYASAVVDEPTGDILIKVANTSAEPKSLTVDVKGLKKKQRLYDGNCTFLHSDDLKRVNTLDKELLYPRTKDVAVDPSCIQLELPGQYFGVYRIPTSPKEDRSYASDKDYKGYLFTYFTGNAIDEEAICYAVSEDGYNYKALNGGKPIMDSREVSHTGGMRDPHILRGANNDGFYMVATDMVSSNGWSSNRGMVLMKSKDLLDWETSVVNIQKLYPNQWNLKRVWAPQTIYDREAGKYLIYWSMKHGDAEDIIYYAYANPDFTGLEGEPKVLFLPQDGMACIDGDIIYHDGLYHMFYKTEGHGNGIRVATTKSLTSGEWTEDPEPKQQTTDAVEGAGTFKLIGQDKYILMYDVYMKGAYQFTETTDLKNFNIVDEAVTMDFHPRHGTVIAVTEKELNQLRQRWP